MVSIETKGVEKRPSPLKIDPLCEILIMKPVLNSTASK